MNTPFLTGAFMRLIALPYRLLVPPLALALCACTTQAWYQGMKTGAENECLNQPPGAMERCQERLNKKSFDEYQRERSEKK